MKRRLEALDDPVWGALRTSHAGFALRAGRAACYPAEMSPFGGVEAPDADALRDLAGLVPGGGFVALFAGDAELASDVWSVLGRFEAIQMVCESAVAPPSALAEPLAASDVPEMLALAELARPGPFGPRTLEMGRYLGFRVDGMLVAMGGERLRPAGFTEVSAICTRPEQRGRGLAEALVRALASAIQARGEIPFLHVQVGSPSEATASALYQRLGFRERMRPMLAILQRRQDDASRAAPGGAKPSS